MKQRGILSVISGFSGSGKGTLVKELLEKYSGYALSVSATTRNPRPGEEDGREYFFVTKERFQEMIEKGQLLEYAQYVENYYGTPRAYVESQLEAGKDVILEIEIQGALKIKEQFPEALLLFVMPPSAQELKRRLVGRGTETAEVIHNRLQRAVKESEEMEAYDYLLINDNLEECAASMHQLIQSQRSRVSGCRELIRQMQEELKQIAE